MCTWRRAASVLALVGLGAASACGTTPHPRAIPTLGQRAGIFAHAGRGFGTVRPSVVDNGGDPTGVVIGVVWTSWGGPRAVGTGTSDWVGPGQTVAAGSQEPVRIVAFRLGRCDGRRMYRAVEWYFPQHGERFDPGRYEDICTGTYVPAP